MPEILLVGGLGQLGFELATRWGSRCRPVGRAELDLCDAGAVTAAISSERPRVVVNCAAYNLVDRAEDESELAFAVNAFGPRNLARACAAADVPLLHVSSDYVFGLDRSRSAPWTESDSPGPVSAYGTSKLTGEWFVRSLCPKHWVVRTCGLYGIQATRGKGNFVETMLRLGRERPELKIVADQFCTPTAAGDLADQLVRLVETDAWGLYHGTNTGGCSWLEFAREIFLAAGLSTKTIPITTAEYGAKAARPAFSVLNSQKLATVTGVEWRPWQAAVHDYVTARLTKPPTGETA